MKKNIFNLICIILYSTVFWATVLADAPVPVSETVVVAGELNDSFENASFFDHETVYTFGQTPQAGLAYTPLVKNSVRWFSRALFSPASLLDPKVSFKIARLVENPKVFWRKTKIEQPGAMIVSLEYEKGSNYDLQVYNSCMENICNYTTIENNQTTLFEENCNAGNLNARWTGGISTFSDTENVFKHNNGGWSDIYNNTAYDSMALDVSFTAKIIGGWNGANSNLRFKFLSNQQDRDTGGLGYAVDIWGNQYIRLRKHTETQETTLIDAGIVPQSGTVYQIRVTRNAQGTFELFVDGQSKGTATDASYTKNSFIIIASDSSGAEIDSIKINSLGSTGGGGAKTCAINVTNDFYYFKVTHLNGTGKYTLDADFVEGNAQANNAKTCSKPFITIVSPAIDPQIVQGETQDFEVTAKDLDGESIQYSWFVDDKQLTTDKNFVTVNSSDLSIGAHTVKARVSDGKFSDEYYWLLTIAEPEQYFSYEITATGTEVWAEHLTSQEILLDANGEQPLTIPTNAIVKYFLLRNGKWQQIRWIRAKTGDIIKITQSGNTKKVFKNNKPIYTNNNKAFTGIKVRREHNPISSFHSEKRTATQTGTATIKKSENQKQITPITITPPKEKGGTITNISYTVTDDNPEVTTYIETNTLWAKTETE